MEPNGWLNDCPEKFKPVFYKRHVDHIFVLFSKHKNISFSFESEKDGQIPFFGVKEFRENAKFVTNVYGKETFTEVCTNFSGFIPLDRCFFLVSEMSKFHFQIEKLKEILLSKRYSNKFIDK